MRTELQDIVDEVSARLGVPAILEDRDFNLVAFGSQAAAIDRVREESILRRRSTRDVRDWFEQFGIATSERPVRTPADPSHGVLARVCVPVRWNGVTHGYLWVTDERGELDDARLEPALRGAGHAAAILARQARTREHLDETLRDLLGTDRDVVDAAAAELAESGPIGRDVPVRAVVLGHAPTVPINLWRLPRSMVAAGTAEQTTLLTAGAAGELARLALELHAERGARPVAGVGAPVADLAWARGSWLQARLAVRAGEADAGLGAVVDWSELGARRLAACGPHRALRDAVLDPPALALLEHPELANTVRRYLDNAGSAARTAAALRVHRQTLYYRLRRVEEVTGLRLADGQHRLRLHLAVTLAPLVT